MKKYKINVVNTSSVHTIGFISLDLSWNENQFHSLKDKNGYQIIMKWYASYVYQVSSFYMIEQSKGEAMQWLHLLLPKITIFDQIRSKILRYIFWSSFVIHQKCDILNSIWDQNNSSFIQNAIYKFKWVVSDYVVKK